MAELRLPKLTDHTPVKMTISLPPDLHRALTDYAALYQDTYGEAEPVRELIPAMLASLAQAFDSDLRRRCAEGAGQSIVARSEDSGSAASVARSPYSAGAWPDRWE